MPDDDTTQHPPKQPQPAPEQPLVSDPGAQQLLELVMKRMGGPAPEDALRRSLETILAMYDAGKQGGEPIIRYVKTRTEQKINLPGAP